MFETGVRASETVALTFSDVEPLKDGLVAIRRGAGMKGRVAPFGPQTAAALDRYLRARRSHKLASTSVLWLGVEGKSFAYFGLNDTLRDRAKRAGIEGFHLPPSIRARLRFRWQQSFGE